MSYNILADYHAEEKRYDKYFFSNQYLDFEYRSMLILEELKQSGADFICLQELDHVYDFYKPKLLEIGYELVSKNLEVQNGFKNTIGCAYKHQKYRMLDV